MKIKINNDERVLFVGVTGSGKTKLAKHLLKRLNRVLVIDPKHTFQLEGFKVRRSLPMIGSEFRVIYRPRLEDDGHLAGLLAELMRGKHVTIYCDELSTLNDMYPLSTLRLMDIARTGRERHVAVWTAFQRPRWIPRLFLTESEVRFMFYLPAEDDRMYMAQFFGRDAQDEIDYYEFWYSHAKDRGEVSLMRLDLDKNYIEKIG